MLSGNDNTNYPVCGLKSYARDGDTNQRIGFDLSEDGQQIFVGTGSNEGVVKIYDTAKSTLEYVIDVDSGQGRDAVNGVSVVNVGSKRLLAVAVGSRHFVEESDEDVENLSLPSPGSLRLYAFNSRETAKEENVIE
jgi:WD40 repeat protein